MCCVFQSKIIIPRILEKRSTVLAAPRLYRNVIKLFSFFYPTTELIHVIFDDSFKGSPCPTVTNELIYFSKKASIPFDYFLQWNKVDKSDHPQCLISFLITCEKKFWKNDFFDRSFEFKKKKRKNFFGSTRHILKKCRARKGFSLDDPISHILRSCHLFLIDDITWFSLFFCKPFWILFFPALFCALSRSPARFCLYFFSLKEKQKNTSKFTTKTKTFQREGFLKQENLIQFE